jgi:hypothetical protein|uniref:Uncharacterized protein n=1 Tax=viral metagenome TaxID=1070528 RepID=A0A6C0B391_9ZZZZ
MLDKLAHVLASALVFALFVPGVLVTLGGRSAVLVHAVLFALVHQVVRHFLDGLLATLGVPGLGAPKKKLYGEDGHGIRQM